MLASEIYSVNDINRIIKSLVEENIPAVWIEGEISNYKPHHSGHIYFTLKDSNSQISAVIWKSRSINLTFDPEVWELVQQAKKRSPNGTSHSAILEECARKQLKNELEIARDNIRKYQNMMMDWKEKRDKILEQKKIK